MTNEHVVGRQQKNQHYYELVARIRAITLFYGRNFMLDKSEAIEIITECAKSYETNLRSKNLFFIKLLY